MVQAFTHAPATVDGERGGKFRLLDGNVFGEFTELVSPTVKPLTLKILSMCPLEKIRDYLFLQVFIHICCAFCAAVPF